MCILFYTSTEFPDGYSVTIFRNNPLHSKDREREWDRHHDYDDHQIRIYHFGLAQ